MRQSQAAPPTQAAAKTGHARLSPCGRYRYRLERRFGAGPDLVWVMLNPSSADAHTDDPTIRKCIGFATRMGYGGIVVVNLFALRATDPAQLWQTPQGEREGSDNIAAWQEAISNADVVLAWGAHARKAPDVAKAVSDYARQHARRVIVLRQLRDATPAHPLMLGYDCIGAIAP